MPDHDHDTFLDALLAGTLGVAEHGLPVAQEPVIGRYGVVGEDGAWRPRREVDPEPPGVPARQIAPLHRILSELSGRDIIAVGHLVDGSIHLQTSDGLCATVGRHEILRLDRVEINWVALDEVADPDTDESRQHILPHEGTTDWDNWEPASDPYYQACPEGGCESCPRSGGCDMETRPDEDPDTPPPRPCRQYPSHECTDCGECMDDTPCKHIEDRPCGRCGDECDYT
jgi:hypothetical protein